MITMLPCYSLEDFSIYRTSKEAEQIFSAWTALYHPALIRHFGAMPSWDRVASPSPGKDRHLIVIPPFALGQVSRDWLKRTEAGDAVLIKDKETRQEIVETALAALNIDSFPDSEEDVETFYALGFSHFVSELFSRKLRYMSNLDTQRFCENGLKAAKALGEGDHDEFEKRIRRAFELLTEAKEYFFPTAMKLLDLTVVSRTSIAELPAMLRRRAARGESTNLLLPTWHLSRFQEESPEGLELLKSELKAGRVTLIGGDLDESPLWLFSPDEAASRLLEGWSAYYEILGTVPSVFGRNEAGYSPILPRLLRLIGCENALLFTEDGWKASDEGQSRIDWRGAGGGKVAGLSRPPLDGASAKAYMELPDRVGYSSSGDRVLTSVFKHHPGSERIWLSDLARMTRFAPVLGTVRSMNEFFKETASGGTDREFSKDRFRTNYLTRADRDGRRNPVSVWPLLRNTSARMNELAAFALFAGLASSERSIVRLPGFSELERMAAPLDDLKSLLLDQITTPIRPALEGWNEEDKTEKKERSETAAALQNSESKRLEQIEGLVQNGMPALSAETPEAFARLLLEPGETESGGEGVCFVNMNPFPVRTETETLFQNDPEVNPFLRVREYGARRQVTVTTPPFSVLRLKKAEPKPDADPQPESAPVRRSLLTRLFKRGETSSEELDKTVRFQKERYRDGSTESFYAVHTKFFDMKIDADTGAVRSVRTAAAAKVTGRRGLLNQPGMGNRVAWQIAMKLSESLTKEDHRSEQSGLYGYSLMAADQIDVLDDGPWNARLRIRGHLNAPNGDRLAGYEEEISAARDSRVIEVKLTLEPEVLPTEAPWEEYYGVRFAWNDNLAEIQPGCQGLIWETNRDYFQAPDLLDIRSEEELGVTILSGGLPYYRRRGGRMADSVLIPRGESERVFRFGVGIDLPEPLEEAARFAHGTAVELSGVSGAEPSLIRYLEVTPASAAVLSLTPVYEETQEEDPLNARLQGFRVLLQETAEQKTSVTLKTRFPLISASPVDLFGRPDGDAFELTDPHSFTFELGSRRILPIMLEIEPPKEQNGSQT